MSFSAKWLATPNVTTAAINAKNYNGAAIERTFAPRRVQQVVISQAVVGHRQSQGRSTIQGRPIGSSSVHRLSPQDYESVLYGRRNRSLKFERNCRKGRFSAARLMLIKLRAPVYLSHSTTACSSRPAGTRAPRQPRLTLRQPFLPQTTWAGPSSARLRGAVAGLAAPASGRETVLDFGLLSRSHRPSSPTTNPERHTILTHASLSAR